MDSVAAVEEQELPAGENGRLGSAPGMTEFFDRCIRARPAVLLAVLVTAVAVAGFVFAAGRWTSAAVRDSAESQLADRVRGGSQPIESALDAARVKALIVATDPVVQRLLIQGDASALGRHLKPNVRVDAAGRTMAGHIASKTAPVSVSLVASGHVVGAVVVGARLPALAYPFLVAKNGRIVAGTGRLEKVSIPEGRATEVNLAGRHYLALGAVLPARGSNWVVAAVIPSATLARRLLVARLRLGGAAAAALGALAAGMLLLREARRRRMFRVGMKTGTESALTLGLLGDALAATHEPAVLLPVILRAFVRASNAAGGRVVEASVEVARWGRWSSVDERSVIALGGAPGTGPERLVELYGLPVGSDPVTDALMQSLAAQAQTALENAHLHEVVEQQASTDELTRLPNRRRFMEALHREQRRIERFGGNLAVVLADLDDFKRVNDRFGHQAGDDVLVAFADAVRAELRDIDLPARIGGEEFAILLPETDINGAISLAERIRANLGERRLHLEHARSLRVTASFGVAAQRGGEDADLLLLSDAALYRAKRRGKNRVVA